MFNLFHTVLKIDTREVGFTQRRFTCSQPAIRERLESIGRYFLHGYHAALKEDDPLELSAQLEQVGNEYRGFAYEGAAMALALLDGLHPRTTWPRLSLFMTGPGKKHIYMLHVGAGWAIARLPWLRRRVETVIRKFHPVFGWLAIDGYGFHEGYFHWRSNLQPKIAQLAETARHVFYQGLGRSLWFIYGADSAAIVRTILTFPPQFQADAWSGLGLGCAYAGGIDQVQLEELRWLGRDYSAALAQGAAFAAGARHLGGNHAPHTELACMVLCGISAEHAAALCDQALEQVTRLHSGSYQKWREMVQHALAGSSEAEVPSPIEPISSKGNQVIGSSGYWGIERTTP